MIDRLASSDWAAVAVCVVFILLFWAIARWDRNA